MSSDFYTTSIDPYAAIIIKICRAYTHTQEDFEDYYQEVCLQLFRSKENFRKEANWATWVYRVALNVCMTLFKKKKSSSKPLNPDQLPSDHSEHNQAFEDEPLELLYTAIRQLSEVDRAVILLYLEEKSYQEIAEIMGTNPNNIGVRINRIKERLKKILHATVY
ncbi:MAG: sigma-70 family RNA polymerase sigma factor [Bacteroidota bacterium]